MAGAGYKLFNTGDVLTAAQVNTYLMEQTVMVFADAAARTTALTGVVSEGMISYLKDTNAVEVYNGSAWVSSDDPNAIQNTIVDAKGDLITATAADTPARLAVGNNGETLVADSSTATGLRYTGLFGANKNKIINGDFFINQRSFVSGTTTGTYGFDRWVLRCAGDGTATYSAQTFTPGAAPVAGYEAANYARLVTVSQTTTAVSTFLSQAIEDVRTFAGQTVTVSFWAKANSGTPKIAVELDQQFGSGGSTRVANYAGQVTLSTSWTRLFVTFTIPSISGKTLGTGHFLGVNLFVSAGSDFNARTGSLGIQNNTFDIWGVQAEAGSVATPFQTMTGTLAGELAACQRYYWRNSSTTGTFPLVSTGYVDSATDAYFPMVLPTEMRVAPTSPTYSNLRVYDASALNAVTAVVMGNATTKVVNLLVTSSGLTAGRACALFAGTTGNPYIDFTAEL